MSDDICNNEFCVNHKSLHYMPCEAWHNTKCSLYEVDPYDEMENPTGFQVSECPALLKYRRMGHP